MPETLSKNPAKVRAGLIGARARWGEQPRVVRLDTLSRDQAQLVLALIDAARGLKKATPAAAAEIAQEVDRDAVDHTTARSE